MTPEELQKVENSMTKEQILERAKTLRPVAVLKNMVRYWVNGGQIHHNSYTWSLQALKPARNLRELGRIKTYHLCGHPSLFKPSVDECIYQCPYPEAIAFQIMTEHCIYNSVLNRHETETIYYTGEMPEDIRGGIIEW